jgi:hypothetical protein
MRSRSNVELQLGSLPLTGTEFLGQHHGDRQLRALCNIGEQVEVRLPRIHTLYLATIRTGNGSRGGMTVSDHIIAAD